MQSLMSPLPVTDESLRREPQSYLAWLHIVLADFQDAQDMPHAPKLFTMTPQASSQARFITINSASHAAKACIVQQLCINQVLHKA